jgi:cell division protein FtsI (penicillin-binding protein 3)
MMEGVVISKHGTGRKARLEGYSSGGKTGTAQIFDVKAHRYTHQYNASFMGFTPVTNPSLVIVVTVNGTTGSAGYGAGASAPVFKAVATEALRVLDIPKDLPEAVPEPDDVSPSETNDLAIADLGSSEPNIMEELATEQNQAAVAPVAENGPKVPNFRGKTMRAVVEEASALGIAVQFDGSGTARAQVPLPGSALRAGERVRVQFAR